MITQLERGRSADRALVEKALRHWQEDSDLTGLRDIAALAKLTSDQQPTFIQLWADVAALLKKAEEKAK